MWLFPFFFQQGHIFQQIIGIPMGTNCPLLVDLFLYSYDDEFIQKLLKDQTNKNTNGKAFNLTFRYFVN